MARTELRKRHAAKRYRAHLISIFFRSTRDYGAACVAADREIAALRKSEREQKQ